MAMLDRTLRAETVRLWAMAAYLPGVALGLLVARRTREIRLIRFHAFQALGLMALGLLLLLSGSAVATIFGAVPGLELVFNFGVGLGFLLLFPLGFALALHGALAAYAGRYTRLPWLTDWVWLQVNGRPAPRRRRARRSEPPEDEAP